MILNHYKTRDSRLKNNNTILHFDLWQLAWLIFSWYVFFIIYNHSLSHIMLDWNNLYQDHFTQSMLWHSWLVLLHWSWVILNPVTFPLISIADVRSNIISCISFSHSYYHDATVVNFFIDYTFWFQFNFCLF